MTKHLGAAFGLIHVGGADDDASRSSSTSCCTISHRSRRDSGSTPTLGSSSSSSSGERTSVQARPSFCFMPPESLPAGRSVKRARSVISSSRAKRSRARLRRHAVKVGVEVQVFLHAQILVEAEALRHVADAILHGLRICAATSMPSTRVALRRA